MKRQKQEAFPSNPEIIFMGTPDFSVPALEALVENGHNVLSVVTQPDRPKGRGKKIVPPPVKTVAVEFGLEVLQPENASDENFCGLIRQRDPDLLIVVAFGQVLKGNLLKIPRCGAINIHASLLPKYRGAAPIQRAILNYETVTGLTSMRMDEGLDTGPILLQEEISIHRDETAGELHDRLALLSGPFLLKTLNEMAENRLTERPQNNEQATYAPKLDRSISEVNWNKSASEISAIIRALDPWPGAFTTFKGKRVKLFSSSIEGEGRIDLYPGRVSGLSEEALYVETGEGIVVIRELQLPGKGRLAAGDFLRGFPLDRGAVLGR